MYETQPRRRIGLLIGAHGLLGLGVGLVALLNPGWDWPISLAIWYMGLLCSETLLLGVWAGLSATRWWIKLFGLAAGIGWLTCLSFAPDPSPMFSDLLAVVALHVCAVLGVALCLSILRWRFAQLDRRSRWESYSTAAELQFSLRSLIGLTVVVALLLGAGRLVQWLDGGESRIPLVVLVFAVLALLASVLVVWSCLGPGRVIVRGPIMLVGMMALGLVFPYYLGGPDWRFLVWPALMGLVAVYAGASLLIVRSCGYRLVPRRPPATPPPDVAEPGRRLNSKTEQSPTNTWKYAGALGR